MGKISDALEKHEKETTIKVESLYQDEPKRTLPEEGEPAVAKRPPVGRTYDHKLVVLSEPDSADAENFKILRGQILFGKDHERPRTIMVTSAFPGEGKTFVASNLGASIAMGIDEYVLLVDCDLRRPSLHHMFGYGRGEGLHEYLVGKKDLADLLIRTEINKMSLLSAGKDAKNPSELLASRMMEQFLEEVKGRYDDRFIIIDTTPSQVTAEANVLANHVDGVILVVMAGKSPRKAIDRTIENLGREKILGVVFNGYAAAHKDYKRYYKKYYN
ncbi:MAG: polysaccharide biosynthesis tyrosine autokinase [Desulfatiglandales bacterium]